MSQLYKSLKTWEDDDDGEEEEDNEKEANENEEEGETENEENTKVGYFVNLDPATKMVPYGASIDIRDTVDYKEVMKQHNLGPNGKNQHAKHYLLFSM